MASRTGSGKVTLWTAVCVAAAAMALMPSSLLAQSARKGAPAKAAASAEPPKPVAFVAPPRTISDITAILDSEKPDPEKIAKLVTEAEAPPPKLPPLDLAEWHYKRSQARASLGRTQDAIADAELAVKLGQGDDYADGVSRYEQFLIRQLRTAGERKRALDLMAKQQRAFANQSKGRNFWLNLATGTTYLTMGDFGKAAAAIERNRALIARGAGLAECRALHGELSFECGRGRGAPCGGARAVRNRRTGLSPLQLQHDGRAVEDAAMAERAAQGRLRGRHRLVHRAGGSRRGEAGPRRTGRGGCAPRAAQPAVEVRQISFRQRRHSRHTRLCAAGAGPIRGSRATAISGRRHPEGAWLRRRLPERRQCQSVRRATPQPAASL